MLRCFSLYRRGRIFYCQFYNPKTGKYHSGRSTGQESRNGATMVVYEWQRNGIPEPGSGARRSVSTTIDVETILETIRKVELTPQDAERIVAALKTRGIIESAVVKAGPDSELFFLRRNDVLLKSARLNRRTPDPGGEQVTIATFPYCIPPIHRPIPCAVL